MRRIYAWIMSKVVRRDHNCTLVPPPRISRAKKRDNQFRPRLMMLEEKNAPGSMLAGLGETFLNDPFSSAISEMVAIVGPSALAPPRNVNAPDGISPDTTPTPNSTPAETAKPQAAMLDPNFTAFYSGDANSSTNNNSLIPSFAAPLTDFGSAAPVAQASRLGVPIAPMTFTPSPGVSGGGSDSGGGIAAPVAQASSLGARFSGEVTGNTPNPFSGIATSGTPVSPTTNSTSQPKTVAEVVRLPHSAASKSHTTSARVGPNTSASTTQPAIRFEARAHSGAFGSDITVRGLGYGATLNPTSAVFQLGTDSIRQTFVGANAGAKAVALDVLAPASGDTAVAAYGKLTYQNVWNGIDVNYYSSPLGQLEFDFTVNPGADVSQIQMNFAGASSLAVNSQGALVIHAGAGKELIELPRMIYQNVHGVRQAVAGRYTLLGDNRAGFSVSAYDHSLPLVIDPLLLNQPLIDISQIYAQGGATGAAYNRDYIELLNRDTSAIDLSAYSLQYADAGSGTWQVVALTGAIQPGQYKLIAAASNGSAGANLPTPDLQSSLALAAAGGKVALVSGTAPLTGTIPSGSNIVDEMGYGTADFYEGSAAAADLTDPTMADVRLGNGNVDNEDNSWDFIAATPTPRNSVSPIANLAPRITAPNTQWTNTGAARVFSSANGNAVSVSDQDAGNLPLLVDLSVDTGTLTLAATTGLTITIGTGTNDTTMEFTGSQSAINAALNGLRFAPTAGERGESVIGISVNDQGNTGAGGAQSNSAAIGIVVGGPLVALDDQAATDENKPVTVAALDNDLSAPTGMAPASLRITSVSSPAHGTAAINHDGSSNPVPDTITYTPNAEFIGADSFTYQIGDGLGNVSTATISIAVNYLNAAALVMVDQMANNEGDAIDFGPQMDNAAASAPMTFTATGLPEGVSINATTGEITGRLTYGTAEVNNGIYHVTISANSSNGDDHGSATFEWDVTDTNRLAWMDDQVSPYYVTGIVHAVDAFNHPITYGAVGLPTGFTINPQTGSLTGGTPEAQITMFSVTLSATDGTYTDYRSFRWTILGGNTPAIFLGLNDTYNSSDDLVVLNSPSTYHIRVFLYDPAASVPVSVEIKALDNNGVQSDKVSLGGNVLQMRGGDSAEVLVVPIKESGAENDVHFVAFLNHVAIKDVPDSVISLHVSPVVPLPPAPPDPTDHIRAPNTPTGMADRIPPRTPTPYIVWYTMGTNGNKITDMEKYFWIRVPANPNQEDGKNGMSWKNGYIVLKDAAGKEKSWDKFVPAANPNGYKAGILGWSGALPGTKKVITAQTQPGNAGKLFFTLFDAGAQDDNGKKEYESKGFSVAAIPVNWSVKKDGDITDKLYTVALGGRWRGLVVDDSWESDSGHISDLDMVYNREILQTVDFDKKIFPGQALQADYNSLPMSSFVFADGKTRRHDLHVVAVAKILRAQGIPNPNGYSIDNQVTVFWDYRTGAVDIPVANSGYVIDTRIKPVGGVWMVITSKTGKAVTAKGPKYTVKAQDYRGNPEQSVEVSSGAGATDPAANVSNQQGVAKPN